MASSIPTLILDNAPQFLDHISATFNHLGMICHASLTEQPPAMITKGDKIQGDFRFQQQKKKKPSSSSSSSSSSPEENIEINELTELGEVDYIKALIAREKEIKTINASLSKAKGEITPKISQASKDEIIKNLGNELKYNQCSLLELLVAIKESHQASRQTKGMEVLDKFVNQTQAPTVTANLNNFAKLRKDFSDLFEIKSPEGKPTGMVYIDSMANLILNSILKSPEFDHHLKSLAPEDPSKPGTSTAARVVLASTYARDNDITSFEKSTKANAGALAASAPGALAVPSVAQGKSPGKNPQPSAPAKPLTNTTCAVESCDQKTPVGTGKLGHPYKFCAQHAAARYKPPSPSNKALAATTQQEQSSTTTTAPPVPMAPLTQHFGSAQQPFLQMQYLQNQPLQQHSPQQMYQQTMYQQQQQQQQMRYPQPSALGAVVSPDGNHWFNPTTSNWIQFDPHSNNNHINFPNSSNII